MRKYFVMLFLFFGFVQNVQCQNLQIAARVFSHNDYQQAVPFYNAYNYLVGYIEADVFLRKNALLVAHTSGEIDPEKTLEKLYLDPLREKIILNHGNVYADSSQHLTLMIDLKSDGSTTLEAIVNALKKYPEVVVCKNLKIAVSGDVPRPTTWTQYPPFIFFDGRPNVAYTAEQLNRIIMISTSFGEYSSWNGKGKPAKNEADKIFALRDNVHAQGKKLRFWGSPDFKDAWLYFLQANIDIIGTDHPEALIDFLKGISSQ
jgi:alkaline phosphatase